MQLGSKIAIFSADGTEAKYTLGEVFDLIQSGHRFGRIEINTKDLYAVYCFACINADEVVFNEKINYHYPSGTYPRLFAYGTIGTVRFKGNNDNYVFNYTFRDATIDDLFLDATQFQASALAGCKCKRIHVNYNMDYALSKMGLTAVDKSLNPVIFCKDGRIAWENGAWVQYPDAA